MAALLAEMPKLTESELDSLLAYWEAANYLTVAQIYLQDNALLRDPLRPEHIKPRLLDEAKDDGMLSAAGAAVPVVLIQAREDIEIATQVRAFLPVG